jgi:hypothetical protein
VQWDPYNVPILTDGWEDRIPRHDRWGRRRVMSMNDRAHGHRDHQRHKRLASTDCDVGDKKSACELFYPATRT